jgi:esterase FrsA
MRHRLPAIACAVLFFANAASAQQSEVWQTRTWPELKAETQSRADHGVYPLEGLDPKDVSEALSKIDSLDPEKWAAAWMAIGDRYELRAKAELTNHPNEAREDFHKAWLNYAFGRWPSPTSPGKITSYQKAKEAFLSYARLSDPRIEMIKIPFEGKQIVAYLQRPKGVRRPPIVLDLGGADEWMDFVADSGTQFVKAGIADVAVDMPGTGEAPLAARPGAERIYSALIDYLRTRDDLDGSRIVVRSISWGSYWSLRVAYANADRLKGAVFQSGAVDAYFKREWQDTSLHTKEYLFDFVASRLFILGQPNVEAMLDFMPSLSLKAGGLIDKPAPPMLLIAGAKDTQNPISDVFLLLQSGTPKTAWINPQGGHMGRDAHMTRSRIFDEVILPWVERRLRPAS